MTFLPDAVPTLDVTFAYGDTWDDPIVTHTDATTGAPISFVGYNLRIVIKSAYGSGASLLTLDSSTSGVTILSAPGGQWVWAATSVQTSALPMIGASLQLVYTVTLYNTASPAYDRTLLRGSLTVIAK